MNSHQPLTDVTSSDTKDENIITTPSYDQTQGLSDTGGKEEAEQTQYPVQIHKLIINVAALAIGQFLLGLDSTIVSTAAPKITDQFHALGDIGWYASVFTLTFCAFQLMWGKLFTFFPGKLVYLAGFLVFEVGSLVCAVASSSMAFIVGRALAGLGAGGAGAGSLLIIAHLVPPPRRPTLVGILCSTFGFGNAIGPLLGGAFTDNPALTWRWCFYINLPLGAVSGLIVIIFIPMCKPKGAATITWRERLLRMDFPGAVLLVPAVVCLLMALEWGGSRFAWSNGRIIALFILAGILGIGFLVSQAYRKNENHVMVVPRLFKDPRIWASSILGGSTTASFFTMLYYIPVWFQAIKSATPVASGILNLPMTISFLIASTLGGALSSTSSQDAKVYCPSRVQERLSSLAIVRKWNTTTTLATFAFITPLLLSAGSALLTTLKPNTSLGKQIGYQIIFGFGAGLGMQTSLSRPQSLPTHNDVSTGTAIVFLFQNLGASIMISVAQLVFNSTLHVQLENIPGLNPLVVTRAGATGWRDVVPPEMIPPVLGAYNKAITATFLVAVGAAAIGILGIIWVPLMWWNARKSGIKDGTGTSVGTSVGTGGD
ncbi:unnamed protein product [Penicillium viridicatum]